MGETGPFSLRHEALLRVALLLLAVTVVAALALMAVSLGLRALTVRAEQRRHALMARWQPTLLDVIVGDVDPGAFHALVRRGEALDALQFLASYALVLAGASRHLLVQMAAPFLDTAGALLTHRVAERRALGVQLLGLLGDPQRQAPLIQALDDPSPEVAMTAARALSRTAVAGYAGPVLVHLERFDTWGSASVASMLVPFGPEAAPALVEVLVDARRSEPARVATAEALRRIGFAPAAHAAAAMLYQAAPPPMEVTAAALRVLRDLGESMHAPAARAFCDAPQPVLRLHAISALALLGDDRDRPCFEAALDDPSPWVAIRAAHGLREAGHADVLEAASTTHPRAALLRQALAG